MSATIQKKKGGLDIFLSKNPKINSKVNVSKGKKAKTAVRRSRSTTFRKSRVVVKKSIASKSQSIRSSPVKNLAMAMCLPGSCPNLRIKSDAGESQPTAATNLHRYMAISQPAVLGTYTSMPTGTTYVGFFRDPLRSTVLFTPNTATKTYAYTAYFHSSANTNVVTLSSAGDMSEVLDLDPIYLAESGSAGFKPHGDYLFCGTYAGKSYVWVDLNATVTFTRSVTTNTTNTDIINVLRWEGDDVDVSSLPFSGTNATVVFTNTYAYGGYYHFSYYSTMTTAAPASLNISFVLGGTGDVFGHLSVPNAINHLAQFTRARINAGSIMTSPTAALINRGGTITAGSIEGSLLWYNTVTPQFLANLPSTNMAEKDYATGMYAFLKPGGFPELSYYDYVVMAGTTPAAVGFPLKNNYRYLSFVLQSDVVGSVSPGEEFLLSLNWDIEYQTSDLWLETHLSSSSVFMTMSAIEMMARVGQFHDNPLHFADIIKSIRGGYNWVRGNVKNVGNWLHTALDVGVPLARGAGNYMINMPEW
jgi:hypothetical protein